ncbi:MAG: dynamin family protein [Cyanobacterium sp. T60_A2020_053]|nr:dynamin family protein [Cyanobacterium sp. T60_A2020_053]
MTSSLINNYSGFESWKKQNQELEAICGALLQQVNKGLNEGINSEKLLTEVKKTLQKLKSQRFRVAIIGEFSKGKSTLLNAWLGEEVQPVSTAPCTGQISILKHGSRKKVICHYKNGHKEEISFEEYHQKVSISEDLDHDDLKSLSEELHHSNIKEIILEHPELTLCQNGVEIVDSPGLNEHPNRSDITKQLINDTDAIIFLTSVNPLLTQGERELLEEIRLEVNNGNKRQSASNLFIVINFFDLIRKEKDRESVEQRVNKLLLGQDAIITDRNRIHFISAQSALDGILARKQDDYVTSFQFFTQSVEQFLTHELGDIKINQTKRELNNLLNLYNSELEQFKKLITGKIKISQQNKQKIFDCIGEATGRDYKMRSLINFILEDVIENLLESWSEWVENLADRLVENREKWTSSQENKQAKMSDYARQFSNNLELDFHNNFESKILSDYLEDYIKLLDEEINNNINAIKNNLESLDLEIGSNLVNQFSLSIANMKQDINLKLFVSKEDSESGAGVFGFGSGVFVAGLLSIFTGGLFLPVALGAAAGGFLGFLVDDDPKQKVLEKGWEKFTESAEDIYSKVQEKIIALFQDRLDVTIQVIEESISICEELINQNNLAYQKTVKSTQITLNNIEQKCRYLEKLKTHLY